MKDHEKRELVNKITKVAQEYGHTQQLRSRMAGVVLSEVEEILRVEKERWCAELLVLSGESTMTPKAIETLIHFYTCSLFLQRHDHQELQEDTQFLLAHRLIEPDNFGGYRTTECGRLHIQWLCNMPWPKQVWVGADGKMLVEEKELKEDRAVVMAACTQCFMRNF